MRRRLELRHASAVLPCATSFLPWSNRSCAAAWSSAHAVAVVSDATPTAGATSQREMCLDWTKETRRIVPELDPSAARTENDRLRLPVPEPVELCVQPGELVAGKYRVERVLGAGGMGVVVAAHHLQLDEQVALKFLLPEALEEPGGGRALRSRGSCGRRRSRASTSRASSTWARSRAASRTWSWSTWTAATSPPGSEQHGPLPIAQAVEFVLQACEAIAEAHALGHRASRSQAGEPILHPPRRRPAVHQSPRLRDLEGHGDRRRRAERPHDGDDGDCRLAALHVARADAGVEGGSTLARTSGRWGSSSSSCSRGVCRSMGRW